MKVDQQEVIEPGRTSEDPSPELRFRREMHFVGSFRDLWRVRELVRTLAERDLRARYKQAALGMMWAVLTPLALMLVFTLFLQRVAKFDTGGVPYALFSYLGLLPWTFFSTSVSIGGQSLVSNSTLLNKVYCPREVFPLASVVAAGFDMAVAALVLAVLFAISGFAPKATAVWVPVLLPIQILFTISITLIVSSVLVYLRDLRHVLPIVLQLGLFASPVAYGMSVIPSSFRGIYSAINPLAAVIDSYRRTVLLGLPPDWKLLAPAAATTVVLFAVAYTFFKRMETGFADVA